MKQVAAALLKARKSFGPALKSKVNPAFRSKYADLAACLDAVEQPCIDAGLFLYQETFDDATGVTVETVFLHESGESLRCGRLHVPAAKQDPQGYGSALSYARRYSLMTACGIAAEDDDGNAASNEQQRPQAVAEKPFDLNVALDWIKKGKTTEEVKQRGRTMYHRATMAEEKARIAALVEELEQAAMAAA